MEMNMPMNTSMSGSYFVFSKHIMHFLFENLHINTTAGIVGVSLLCGFFTFLLEGGKSIMLYVQLRLKQNPLTYGQTSTSIQADRSPLFSALMIPSSIQTIRTQRIQFHVAGYFLHTINLIVGYLLMLAVMTFDAYIIIAVIVGSGLGYYIFGAVNAQNHSKFAMLKSRIYERYDSRTTLTPQEQAEEIQYLFSVRFNPVK